MNATTIEPGRLDLERIRAPKAARLCLKLLNRLHGRLIMQLPDRQTIELGQFVANEAPVAIELNNWKVFSASLRDGDIGFAESYIRGDWTTDSLVRTLTLLVRNRDVLEKAIYGSWAGRLMHRLSHLMNSNTRKGAKRNIHAHYDLGNAFYSRWLDKSMTYSSAMFSDASQSLEDAQRAKYVRILEQTNCSHSASILEVGCGWGGFAEMAGSAGMQVRGLTLSTEQLEFSRKRIRDVGLNQAVDLVLQDYRDESTQYDAIVSIEMFEAVGKTFWPSYFGMLERCLKPGGRAVVQTITIANDLFDRYERGSDFIQQYIFPGGMLPSPEQFELAAARQGLRVVDQHPFGLDYARTLSIWHEKFEAQASGISELGFDERFMRTWRFYLAYCEAAFTGGNTDVYQFTLEHA